MAQKKPTVYEFIPKLGQLRDDVLFGDVWEHPDLSKRDRSLITVAMLAALYRTDDYARAGVPMLPVTHGKDYTRLQVLLYTLILFGVSLLPYAARMSGWMYLAVAVALGLVYVGYAVRIYTAYSDRLARSCFRYSIVYLAALFAALLVDHYLAL